MAKNEFSDVPLCRHFDYRGKMAASSNEIAMKKEWTAEERAAIEAKYKAEFTAADLQKYADEDEVVPFEEIIAAVEEQQRRLNEKKA